MRAIRSGNIDSRTQAGGILILTALWHASVVLGLCSGKGFMGNLNIF